MKLSIVRQHHAAARDVPRASIEKERTAAHKPDAITTSHFTEKKKENTMKLSIARQRHTKSRAAPRISLAEEILATRKPAVTTAVPENSVEKTPARKKRRSNAALKQMRKLANTTDHQIPKICFARIVRDILRENDPTGRIEAEAITALQEASEQLMWEIFSESKKYTSLSKRSQAVEKDVALAIEKLTTRETAIDFIKEMQKNQPDVYEAMVIYDTNPSVARVKKTET